MANIFWSGPKAPANEAIASLKKKAVDVWDGPFHTRIKDGVLEFIVEVSDTENDSGLWKSFKEPKFMGYELHILKVPKGYTEYLRDKK